MSCNSFAPSVNTRDSELVRKKETRRVLKKKKKKSWWTNRPNFVSSNSGIFRQIKLAEKSLLGGQYTRASHLTPLSAGGPRLVWRDDGILTRTKKTLCRISSLLVCFCSRLPGLRFGLRLQAGLGLRFYVACRYVW